MKHEAIASLMALSKSAKNKRRTKDGRKCADVFNVDKETVIEAACTTMPSPDGKMTEEEWCKVDPAAGGSPDWGYCEPKLDFDKIRMKTKELMEEEIPEMRKLRTE